MRLFIKVEHYPPAGAASVSIVFPESTKRFNLLLNRPEKERERAIRKVINQMKKLELGAEVTCWAVHKLDQMAAEQREWDETGG